MCETYEQGRSGNLCTSRIEAYGTDYARETTYAYNAVGKLIRETAPDGSEKTWSYDAFGRETVRMEPWAGGEGRAPTPITAAPTMPIRILRTSTWCSL